MPNLPRTPEQKRSQRLAAYRSRREARQFEYDVLDAAATQCDCVMRSDGTLPEGFWLEGVYVAVEEQRHYREQHLTAMDIDFARRGIGEDARIVLQKMTGTFDAPAGVLCR